MYMKAAEMGWSKKKFDHSTQRLFHWEWMGYIRRHERGVFSAAREVVAMIRNVNVKKHHQKSGSKLMPLSIDNRIEFTYEMALDQYEQMKKAGWLNN